MDENERELAWAAGFYDGEGCTSLVKPGPKNKAAIHMTMKQVDRRPLDRFLTAVGLGYITGPASPGGNSKPCYLWQCYRQVDVEAALMKLLPYLSEPKIEQANRVMASKAEYYRLLEGRCPVHTPEERCRKQCVENWSDEWKEHYDNP